MGNLKEREGAPIAKSSSMRRVLDLAQRVAHSEATVLITGESGTGKERLARFVHTNSQRAQGPWVAINCGALPEPLLESELFGHKKGAFTGALSDKRGLFEVARGGTLFLDELGEMSSNMQVRLLRALSERRIRAVGGLVDKEVDVRIIAATHRDLETMVAEGTFREDLYYRLRVVPLQIAPLRERKEDLLPLSQIFMAQACRLNSCGPCSLSSEVLDALVAYAWPGNIRELENAIERAVVLSEGKPKVELHDLPPEVRESKKGVPREDTLHTEEILSLAEVEKRHILSTLARLQGDRSATAQALGIGKNTLWRRLRDYGKVKSRS